MKGDKNMVYFYRMELRLKSDKFLCSYSGAIELSLNFFNSCTDFELTGARIESVEQYRQAISLLKENAYENCSKEIHKQFPNATFKDIEFDITAFNPL